MGEQSNRTDDGVSVSEYCAENLRSFGESDFDRTGDFLKNQLLDIRKKGRCKCKLLELKRTRTKLLACQEGATLSRVRRL